MKFFNWEEEIAKLKINIDKGVGIFAVSTPRNTGKTSSGIKLMLKKYEETNKKFILLRILGEQTKKFRASFNEEYANFYAMTETKIFKINQIDEEKIEKIECGTIINLTSEGNFKSSGDYKDYAFLFFDEFNDVRNIPNLYESFTNLIITLQRFKDHFWVLMASNKDAENNTFLVNWGIETTDNLDDDVCYDLSEEGLEHYYINYSIKTFTGTKNNNSLGRHLAKFNDQMDRYVNNGGFRTVGEKNIINYNLRIAETDIPKWNLLFRRKKFILGYFDFNGEEAIYLKMTDRTNQNLPTFSLGFENGLNEKEAKNISDRDILDIVKLVHNFASNGLLFFTSYETKIEVDGWLHLMLQQLK